MQPGERVIVNQTPFEYMVPHADRGRTWHRFEAGFICPEDGVRGDSVCVRWRLDGAHYPSFRVKDIIEHTHEDAPHASCPACYAFANQVPAE